MLMLGDQMFAFRLSFTIDFCLSIRFFFLLDFIFLILFILPELKQKNV